MRPPGRRFLMPGSLSYAKVEQIKDIFKYSKLYKYNAEYIYVIDNTPIKNYKVTHIKDVRIAPRVF